MDTHKDRKIRRILPFVLCEHTGAHTFTPSHTHKHTDIIMKINVPIVCHKLHTHTPPVGLL